MAAEQQPISNYEDVFEEGDVPKEAQTVHRIRANSTIMQLNKILGECASWGCRGSPVKRDEREGRGEEGVEQTPLELSRQPRQPQAQKREANADARVAHGSCQPW